MENSPARFRERFRTAPLGRWTTASGTFNLVMRQDWEFRPDHTGVYREHGSFGALTSTTLFEWREAGEQAVLLREIRRVFPDGAEESLIEDAPDGGWTTLRYDFRSVPDEAGGTVVVMVEPATGHFHDALAPLSFVGD